jgi:hypothetical protein
VYKAEKKRRKSPIVVILVILLKKQKFLQKQKCHKQKIDDLRAGEFDLTGCGNGKMAQNRSFMAEQKKKTL